MTDRATSYTKPVPKPFKRGGQTYHPVAVAMYGDMGSVVPIGHVIDPVDGDIWATHTVLWASDNGRTDDPDA